MADVKVYGADWCPMTRNTLAFLEDEGVPFDYINIDEDRQAAQWVMDRNDGKEKKPTLDINGQVLSVPSQSELTGVLRSEGILR